MRKKSACWMKNIMIRSENHPTVTIKSRNISGKKYLCNLKKYFTGHNFCPQNILTLFSKELRQGPEYSITSLNIL